MVDDTLTITIQANSGSYIDDVLLTEAGDTTLFGEAFAATVVSASVFVDIFEIDGVAVNNINGNAAMIFTRDGEFESNDEGYGTHIWTGSLLIDLDAIIAGAPGGVVGRATRIQLNLDNTLIAYAASGATSRIEKKDIDGLAITIVPEPTTAVLMGLGLVGLAAIRRGER